MEIQYSQLKKGYILKDEDTLLIHGCNYKVSKSQRGTHYLLEQGYKNDKIFNVLHIKDKEAFCKNFGKIGEGVFPEFYNLRELTNAVIELYEMSPYQVGDEVVINERTEEGEHYPLYYTTEMAKLKGKTLKIIRIDILRTEEGKKLYNGDPHAYLLEGDGVGYNWHTSMFSRATQGKTAKAILVKEDREEDEKPQDEGYRYVEKKKPETHIML